MKTIISLSCWNRPIYLLKVLDGLKRCRNLSNYKLVISADHFDTCNAQQIVEAIEMSRIQHAVETEAEFHETNLGCTGNGRYCLEEGFKDGQDYTIHLEDDTYPSVDLLEYFEQVVQILDGENYFAACTMNRPFHESAPPCNSLTHKLVAKQWFEGAGGFAITRKTWERMNKISQLFGVDYVSPSSKEWNSRGEKWLSGVTISDRLAYDWSMDRFFAEGRFSIFPEVSRVLNIGKSGLHLNSNQWQKTHYNPSWAHNDMYLNKVLDVNRKFDTENVRADVTRYIEDGTL